MRDPKRIPYVMARVQEFWEQHPDWRLGQTLINAVRAYGWTEEDLWNAEDRVIVRGLELLKEKE